MGALAVIPASGIASRVIAGKPAALWTMIAAVEAEIFDDVLLVTDSAELLGLAFSGVTPVELPENVSGGADGLKMAYLNAVRSQTVPYLQLPSLQVCTLSPSTPLTTSEQIRETGVAFEKSGKARLATIVHDPFGWSICEALWGSGGASNPANGVVKMLPRPTESPLFKPTANIVWTWGDPEVDISNLDAETYGYVIPEELAVNIGTEFGYRIAGMLLNQRRAVHAMRVGD